jgi:hypothetical protein
MITHSGLSYSRSYVNTLIPYAGHRRAGDDDPGK